jgi:hypothetical protein
LISLQNSSLGLRTTRGCCTEGFNGLQSKIAPASKLRYQLFRGDAGGKGYYPKVLKGVLFLDPRSWALLFGSFVAEHFVAGRFAELELAPSLVTKLITIPPPNTC